VLGTERVATVLLGAPAEPPHVTDPPDELRDLAGRRFVVAIGTEEKRKGLPLLIEAFDLLARDHDDVHLVLAGAAGNDSTTVIESISSATHSSRIRRLGPVDEPTKAWLLRQSSALAYPSLDEGFGFPVLEAQLAGVPVIATAAGSIPEVSGDAVILIHRRDAAEFAAGLDQALGGAGRLALIEAGIRNAARFSWTATADGLTELYRKVVSAR
jgi:glycosyltransferase involved in cell wall biosynthesis